MPRRLTGYSVGNTLAGRFAVRHAQGGRLATRSRCSDHGERRDEQHGEQRKW